MNEAPISRAVTRPLAFPRVSVVALFVGFCLAIILFRLKFLYAQGGDSFQQGDWMINFASGIVRRGVSGEFAMAMSDMLGMGILDFVILFQGALLGLLVLSAGAMAFQYHLSDRALMLLLGPGYVSFFIYMTRGALRKEILGYLAFLPLLITPKTEIRGVILLFFSFLLYGTAVAFHEVNAFLFPFLAVAMYLRIQALTDLRSFGRIILALSALMAALSLLFSLFFAGISDFDAVCGAIIARGGAPDLCDGIIAFMASDQSGDIFYGLTLLDQTNLISFVAAYALCLLPLIVVLWGSSYRGRDITILLVAGIFTAPLFVVGVDWGRWVVMHSFAATLVIWVYASSFETHCFLSKPLHRVFGPLTVVFCMCFGIQFIAGHLTTGALPEFFDVIGSKVLGL